MSRPAEEFLQGIDGGVKRGGEIYFDRDAAIRLIEQCAVEEFAILGVEAFRLSDGSTEPDPAWIADFSSLVNEQSTRAAEDFVRRAPRDRYFNFVVTYNTA